MSTITESPRTGVDSEPARTSPMLHVSAAFVAILFFLVGCALALIVWRTIP